jgi:hypothetical protein
MLSGLEPQIGCFSNQPTGRIISDLYANRITKDRKKERKKEDSQ